MDLATLQSEKEALLAKLHEVEKQQRDSGEKSVVTSDVNNNDWRGILHRHIARIDPEAGADPQLKVWFDTDKFGTGKQQRALFVRRFVHGDYYAGKAPLALRHFNDEAAREQAIRAALAELETNAMNSYGRLDALTAAQRNSATQRAHIQQLEERLAKMEAMMSGTAPAPAPESAFADVVEDASDPESPSASESDGLPKAAGKRGRPRKAGA